MAGGLRNADLWLIEHLAVPASVHDVEGRFLYINPAGERASGRSNAEWLGSTVTDALPPAARELVEEQFRRAVELGEPTDFETVFIDADGEPRGVRPQYLPIRERERTVAVLILGFEIRPAPRESEVALPPQLTRRQREILALVASGVSTAGIARELSLSPETVRNHVRAVLRELHAHTRAEAVAAAHRLGLLAPTPLRPRTEPDRS